MASVIIYPWSCGTPSITTGGEESGYPIENIYDRNYNTHWQNDDNNEEVVIDFDYGSTVQPDYLILANHNLTDTGYGIKFQYGTGGVGGLFSSAGYLLGDAGTYHDYVSGDSPIWREALTAPGSAYQYYRLTIENLNGTKPYISIISFGVKKTLNANYSLGGSRGLVYGNEKIETTGGQIKVNNLWGPKRKFELSWDDIEETDHDYWEDDIFQEIDGSLYPFFFEDMDSSVYYVRCLNDELPFTDVEYQLYGFNLTLIEEN